MIGFDDRAETGCHHAPDKRKRTADRLLAPRLPGVNAWGFFKRMVGQERRRDERVPQVLWLEEIIGDDRCIRRTGNISLGGVFFDATLPYPVGTRLCLEIPLPGAPEKIRALAQVVSVRDQGQGMALRFTGFPDGGVEHLRQYLKDHQWMAPPDPSV